jgi:magnesium transporter
VIPKAGHLREAVITTLQNLLANKRVWIALIDPPFEDRLWIEDIFGITLPDPDKSSDLIFKPIWVISFN